MILGLINNYCQSHSVFLNLFSILLQFDYFIDCLISMAYEDWLNTGNLVERMDF